MNQEIEPSYKLDALVLYKNKAARVSSLGSKLEIELNTGKRVQVRSKDVILLHPGPLKAFSVLGPQEGDVMEAHEILQGETTTLPELAELVYGQYSPASAWAVWELLQDAVYFSGSPEAIRVHTPPEAEQALRARDSKAAEKEAWGQFIEGIKAGHLIDGAASFLQPLEEFARERTTKDRILKELQIASTPENAHKLLLGLGHWDETENPYIPRLGFATRHTYADLGDFPEEERLDLTHLAAFAIDDEGNQDPDDALSFDREKLWVHIADVAALVPPGSPADLDAAHWGATHYLPEGSVTMLPPRVTALCGLGLQEISPALSFGISLNEAGGLGEVTIQPTRVRVTRISYAQAEERLEQAPFREIKLITDRFRAYRRAQGAVFLNFPEVKIRVTDGQVLIKPLPQLASNDMVLEAMLMAGEGAARFASRHNIPFPFTTQPVPDREEAPADLAAMFAFRRKLKPSQIQCSPGPHGGLGLEMYSRATSPMRRYVDLLAHQQLRAFLAGRPVLDEETMLTRCGTYSAIAGDIVKLERLSNLHWTLVYLLRNPAWQGEGIVVARREREHVVLIPELGLEAGVHLRGEPPELNSKVLLRAAQIDLPTLSVQLQAV